MSNRPAIWLILSSLVFGPTAFAFTANGTVTGGEIIWDNVFATDGGYTLSDWNPLAGLEPTTKWSPGAAYTTTNPNDLTFKSSDGSSSFTAQITLTGMEYNTGNSDFTQNSTSVLSSVECSSDSGSWGGSTVSVIATVTNPCTTQYSLENTSNAVAPFYFNRPIFNFNESDIIDGLKDNNLPEGFYSATIPVSMAYYYLSAGNIPTYYQTQESFTIILRYIPSYLTSVEVTNGNLTAAFGEIVPVYNTADKTVTGSTLFDIKARGYFSEGLELQVNDTDFVLTGEADDSIQIPYSVTCNDCVDSELVVGGKLQGDGITTISNPNDPTEINFQFNVHYDDISASDVETDHYSGNFTVTFKEVL